jgi:hypothetical protein
MLIVRNAQQIITWTLMVPVWRHVKNILLVTMTLATVKIVMKLVKHVLEQPTLTAKHVLKITSKIRRFQLILRLHAMQTVVITSMKLGLMEQLKEEYVKTV